MKAIIFAAALMVSGTALAQTTNTTTDMSQPGTAAPDSMSQTSSAGSPVAPGNSNPERDARGIAVVSDSATAPAGWNAMPGSGMPVANASAPAATQGSAGDLPPCSRKVTDHCTQTYERGARPHA